MSKVKLYVFISLISICHVISNAENQLVLELTDNNIYVVTVSNINSIKFSVVDSIMQVSLKNYAKETIPNNIKFKQISSLFFYDTSTKVSQSSITEKPFAVYYPETSVIKVNTIKKSTVSIYTVDGRCLISKNADNDLTCIDLSNIPIGIYIVVNNNHKQKFIKI
jgi:hypothetical protein